MWDSNKICVGYIQLFFFTEIKIRTSLNISNLYRTTSAIAWIKDQIKFLSRQTSINACNTHSEKENHKFNPKYSEKRLDYCFDTFIIKTANRKFLGKNIHQYSSNNIWYLLNLMHYSQVFQEANISSYHFHSWVYTNMVVSVMQSFLTSQWPI